MQDDARTPPPPLCPRAPLDWRPRYLEAVRGGQAALLPEAEGALQLLGRAQRERVGLIQATQQGQAGREAGQVVTTWDTRGRIQLRAGGR